MSGYDYSQELANAMLEELDITIDELHDKITTLTRQRDLAVEALGKRPAFPCSASDHEAWVDSLYAALSTIKESEDE